MRTIQRVMVVDPSPESHAHMRRVLSKAPLFIVAETGYGPGAINVAMAKRPAIIVISLEAPTEQALRTLRADLPDAEIIGYAGEANRTLLQEALSAGANDVLRAPITGDALMATLRGPASRLASNQARTAPPRGPQAGTGQSGTGQSDTAQSDTGQSAAGQSDTARADHEMPSAARTRAEILTVYSVKGGVGVSTLAANLATAIASQTQARVLTIDLDLRFGDIGTVVDLTPEFSLADLATVDDLDREIFARATTPHESGVDFLLAPAHPTDWLPVSADRLRTIVEFAARLYDYVILDAPSDLDDTAATAIELADRTLLVTSFDRTSVFATARVAQMLGGAAGMAERIRLVLNEVQEERAMEPALIRDTVGLEVYASIPFDAAVIAASESGRAVVTGSGHSRAALAMHALAGDLGGYMPQARPAGTRDRLVQWAGGSGRPRTPTDAPRPRARSQA